MAEFINSSAQVDNSWQRIVFYSDKAIQKDSRVVSNSTLKDPEPAYNEAKLMSDKYNLTRRDVDSVCPQGSQTTNIVHYLRAMERGRYPPSYSAKAWKHTLVKRLHRLLPFHVSFMKKVSALTWHPTYPSILLVGTKGGEIAIHGSVTSGNSSVIFLPETSPRSHVIALKFHPRRPSQAFTASNNGLIRILDFRTQQIKPILDSRATFPWKWLSAFDVCPNKDMFVFGDSRGDLYFRDENGEKIFNSKNIHQNKITHIEFSRKNPSFFVTASSDHTVKVWDIRMISDSPKVKPLTILMHEKGVNSACFSSANFSSLLTTDNHGDLRVYSTGQWSLRLVIAHPHCHQQLTSTKASWHPLADIIVVGHSRKMLRQCSIDFYDADTGNILSKIEPSPKHSASLCALNSQGDILAAKCGHKITFRETSHIIEAIPRKKFPVK